MAYFTIFEGKNDEYYFNLKANNHETILRSEGYKAKSGATNGIESVQKNAPDEDRYELKESKNGQFFFNLKAGNGQIIGTSEMYKTKQGRDNGVRVVREEAPDAPTKE